MLNLLTSSLCSLFSYDALSYSFPQLPPHVSLHESSSLIPAVIMFIFLISGCGLVSLQMRRFIIGKNSCDSAVAEDVHMTAIDGHRLNQKGKPPEDAKQFVSARVISFKPMHMLTDHQKARRKCYNFNDPKSPSLKDLAIEHHFNQKLRRNSNGSIKEFPVVQVRNPLIFEQCSTIDLIRRAGHQYEKNNNKLSSSLLKSFFN